MLKCLKKGITCAPMSRWEDVGRGELEQAHTIQKQKVAPCGKLFFVKGRETGVWRNLHNEELHDLYCISHPLLCG
jgi:hypothetical protein